MIGYIDTNPLGSHMRVSIMHAKFDTLTDSFLISSFRIFAEKESQRDVSCVKISASSPPLHPNVITFPLRKWKYGLALNKLYELSSFSIRC